jgi:long-chain fatty acid transport protein
VPGQPLIFANLGVAKRTEFAQAHLKGSAWGVGAQVGVQGHLSPDWIFGARYLTPMTFKYDNADAQFTQVSTGLVLPAGNPLGLPAGTPVDALLTPQFAAGAPLSSQKVSTKLTHPQQLQVGFAYTGFQNWELEADYAMIGYESFKELPIDFSNPATPDRTLIEDYNNSSSIRLGAEYTFTNKTHVRGGFSGVTRAAPDETVTPLLPEQDRANYSLGATVPVGQHWSVEGGYVLVATPGRRGRLDERTSRTQTAAQLNEGKYSLGANIFALSLKATF